jgi:uncharacterized protein YbcI
MNVESEMIKQHLMIRDLKKEIEKIESVLVVLNENDIHTKTLLTLLWADMKKRNDSDMEKLVGVLYG